MKKIMWKKIFQIVITVLTAIGAAFGLTSSDM